MQQSHAVGIDLGTTYSCVAYLNEHGEPVTIANQEGELATPSVVLFDGDETVIGTEALRNAILKPDCVVQNSKRLMGQLNHGWTIEGRQYSPVDIAALILHKLLDAARQKIGPVDRATITVPAQFSDIQREATIEAGLKAGLKRVDIINEPVAAALCYVLGKEGLWFTELAEAQRILVYDLGGGTFDLSLVEYTRNNVAVLASGGELKLGGIDWNAALQNAISKQFDDEFGSDPRTDPESLQLLTTEVENTKRGLTVRPRAALMCQHAGHRKAYQIEEEQFRKLTSHLVDKTADITKELLKNNKMGWAHVDVILTTGGASRMPMIREKLSELGGRTLNTSLSPDQSIAHGATYYAGMLLTNSEFAKSILSQQAAERLSKFHQTSVSARALGILVRDTKQSGRVPHYLIPANTALPACVQQRFGTVIKNQRRVRLQIIESGTSKEDPYVRLGECVVHDLPPDLPEESAIVVTIRYDAEARVHVSAIDQTSGVNATAEIIREESVSHQPDPSEEVIITGKAQPQKQSAQPTKRKPPRKKPSAVQLPNDDEIIELTDNDVVDIPAAASKKPQKAKRKTAPVKNRAKPKARPVPSPQRKKKQPPQRKKKDSSVQDSGEDEFWQLVD